mgnify:CR=1 FL=1
MQKLGMLVVVCGGCALRGCSSRAMWARGHAILVGGIVEMGGTGVGRGAREAGVRELGGSPGADGGRGFGQAAPGEAGAGHQRNGLQLCPAHVGDAHAHAWRRPEHDGVGEVQGPKPEPGAAGDTIHNPALVNLTLPDAFKAAVASMARAGMYVIADNHVSQGQWCCSANNDVEGFWGEPGFAVQEWLDGLRAMALHVPNLVGISLRNELRGPTQNPSDWHRFMSMGASVVSTANPHLLIFVAGLNNDTDLHFLSSSSKGQHLSINVSNAQQKLVYEMHWYASSYGVNFAQGNLNQVCAIATSTITASGAFMALPNTSSSSFVAPLFISEFGIDQRGGNKASNRYINCLFAFMASLDLDWAYWALQGSYYRRYGNEGDEEYMGILNAQWNAPRNMTFLAKLQAMQQPWKGMYQYLNLSIRLYYSTYLR